MSSKSDKSQVVAGAGWLASIFISLAKKVMEQGGTDKDIHRLATPDGEKILDEIAKLIVGASRQSFKVLVDYTKTLAEMIRAGSYDCEGFDINSENFKVVGQGQQEVEVVLFHFNRETNTEDILLKMERAGYRPARIEELLALGAKHPNLQRQFSIVAFGSVWWNPDGYHAVVYLTWHDVKRDLGLNFTENCWFEDYRFAAVRK